MKTTIRQVAELAGVSITTVSHVLNNKEGTRVRQDTQRRVLEAAKKLNYHVSGNSRPHVHKRTGNLGLLLPALRSQGCIDSEIMTTTLSRICRAAAEMGYGLMVEPTAFHSDGSAVLPSFVRDGKVDGYMVIDLDGLALDSLSTQTGRSMPMVSIDREHNDIDCVVRDNIKGSISGVNYLMEMGCKNIVCLCPGSERQLPGHPVYTERVDGFVLGLARAGVADPVSHVVFVPERSEVSVLSRISKDSSDVDGVLGLSSKLSRRFLDIVEVVGGSAPVMVTFEDALHSESEYDSHKNVTARVVVDSTFVATNAVRLLVNRIQGSVVGTVRIVAKSDLLYSDNSAIEGSQTA